MMKIIPVLDILNGEVVQGVRGKREEYQPVKSVLCASARPLDIALTFKSLGFRELYLPDLDAILGKHINLALFQRIKAETNLDLMIDAGITDLETAKKVLESGASKIVVGTETLNNLNFVEQAIKSFGRGRVMVSIDLKEGKVMSRSEAIKAMNPVELAKSLQEMGVTRVIILDLTRVGTRQGVNLTVVKEVLEKVEVEVLTGGGVRDMGDLEELRDIGVSGVLVATALHTGKVTAKELKSAGFP